jgi:Ca-activated chloride channel family protein
MHGPLKHEEIHMYRLKRLQTLFIFGLLAIGLLATACSPSAESLNKDGNDAFAEEAYLEALAAYEAAVIESPELAEPYYNAANTLYREGAFEEANMLMQEALKYADAESLAQSGFYNSGNSSFNLQEWETAIAAYTEALLRNPDDQDAKYNLELALQQMQQQQEENEEQQDEQSQDGENQEDEQQDQSQDGQDQKDQEQQGDQSSEGDEDQEQENADGQPQDGEGSDEQEGPSQMPQPGQRMTAEQARQLLAAIAQDAETLQEKLGQIFIAPPIPPAQDW